MKNETGTVYGVFRANAGESPDAPAVIGAGRTLSHAQLLEAIDRLAAGLVSLGLAPGERLAILALNSIEFLSLFGACAKTGVIACPINWRLAPEEITASLRLSSPRALAVGPTHLSIFDALAPKEIPLRIVLGPDAPQGSIPVDDLRKTPSGRTPDRAAEDPAAILLTAAVAGLPRGAIITNANLVAAGDRLVGSLGLTPKDCHLAALPLFHITGLGLSLATLQAGGSNAILEAFDPAQASRTIDEHGVTIMADFPPVLQLMLDAKDATGASWASLRLVVGLDAPDTIARLHEVTQARFWTGFGQAETTGVVTLGAVEERPGSAGRALPGLKIRCVDEDDQDVPVGQPGEIVVEGPVVFAGYWGDPDASDFAARGGWHHTGDLGRFDPEGYLFYAGRKPEKELIKTGGENVYPEEVERVIRELPEVAAVCVIGIPDRTYGEAVKAVVELAAGRSLTAQQVQEAVAARIASFKKPRQVEFVEALPRTPDGAIDRGAVKAASA